MYGICCLYCLLSFYQSILFSQRRSVTSTSSGAESSVKAFFFHFAKIIIFSEYLSFFCCFFSLFSLPWLSYSLPCLSHSLPCLSHSLPRLSHSLPWFCSHIPLSNVCPTRPEGAEALSPGHRPGLWCSQTCRPVRAKALKNCHEF